MTCIRPHGTLVDLRTSGSIPRVSIATITSITWSEVRTYGVGIALGGTYCAFIDIVTSNAVTVVTTVARTGEGIEGVVAACVRVAAPDTLSSSLKLFAIPPVSKTA